MQNISEEQLIQMYLSGQIPIEQTITVDKVRVCSFFGGVLLEDIESPYEHGQIPFIPFVVFKFFDEDEPAGIVRDLKDPQREVNKRRSQSLHKEIQQEIKEEVQSGILIANKDIISQLVGLVALFTAMSFLVFGGIASLDSIFKSVERFVNLESSVLPVLMVAVAWAFCMMNLLLCFMYFVLRLVKPEQFTIRSEQHIVQRYPIVFITNYILLILFAVFFSMWFAKCNGIGLPIFNFVISHSVMTFWIGLLIIIAGLAILGIWLYCSYHSKSSQHHTK